MESHDALLVDAYTILSLLCAYSSLDEPRTRTLPVKAADSQRLEVVGQISQLRRHVLVVVRGFEVIMSGVILRFTWAAGRVNEDLCWRLGRGVGARKGGRLGGFVLAQNALLRPVLAGKAEADLLRIVFIRV